MLILFASFVFPCGVFKPSACPWDARAQSAVGLKSSWGRCLIQRLRNDDKNHFWEVESKTLSETKKQPKDRSFRLDVPADIRPKTLVRPSKSWIPGKQAFWHGHAARTSTKKLRSEKLRADFLFPKRGVGGGGSKRGSTGDPPWIGLKHRKTAFGKVAFLLSSLFPRKYSDNNFGQLPRSHPPGGRTRGP